jgi:hypothetical protein
LWQRCGLRVQGYHPGKFRDVSYHENGPKLVSHWTAKDDGGREKVVYAAASKTQTVPKHTKLLTKFLDALKITKPFGATSIDKRVVFIDEESVVLKKLSPEAWRWLQAASAHTTRILLTDPQIFEQSELETENFGHKFVLELSYESKPLVSKSLQLSTFAEQEIKCGSMK